MKKTFFLSAVCLLLVLTGSSVFGNSITSGDHKGRIKSIRKTAQSSQLQGKPAVIKIEIVGEKSFPVVDAAPVLYIGQHSFRGGNYPRTGETNILIFTLTEAEFKNLKSGDSAFAKYVPDSQGKWSLGKLNKKMLFD